MIGLAPRTVSHAY